MGYISELEAVNHMLLMAGESKVTLLDGGLDVGTAQGILAQVINDYVMRGLVGNRVIKKQTLSADGDLLMDSKDIVSGELMSYHENSEGLMIQAQVRGQVEDSADDSYLYNITDQTRTWTKDIEYEYEIIYAMVWDNIDTPLQRAIMAAAARQYQLIMQGDADADNYLANLEAVFTSKAKASNMDDRRRHFISQLPDSGKSALVRIDQRSNRARRYWRTWNG
tara:strand:+ start:85 stop:750 length:666 start_codon:yes stop_codon:yes gene_type:complete